MLFWKRFYDLCIENNTKPNAVCNLLGLSTATATHWKNGTVPKADAVLAISDYFGVSTDYLLGRAEKQQIAPIENDEGDKQENINYSISQNNNNGDNIVSGTKHIEQSKQPNELEYQDEMTSELTKRFNDLSFDKKLDVFNYMKKLSE